MAFLEFVAPIGHPVAGQFAEQWRARAGDPEFQELCRAAQRIDAEYRESTPWRDRCDLDDARIFRAADRPVLINVLAWLYRAILDDVTEVHRLIPRERMRCALNIPYIARENSAAEILALKKGLGARRRMTARWPAGEQSSMCDGWAPDSCYFSGLFLSWQLTHLPVSELPWPGAGGSG